MIQRLFFLTLLFPLALGLSNHLYSQVFFGNRILGDTAKQKAGQSCSISGDGSRIIVGYSGDLHWTPDSGFARVFNKVGGQWVQLGGDLVHPPGAAAFGSKSTISRDGSTVAVGTPADKGLVSVFRWDRNTWGQLGTSFRGDTVQHVLGNSISLSKSGDTIAIGIPVALIPNGRPGSVRVYSWNGFSWTQVGQNIIGENVNDMFGSQVSLSASGQKIAVGATFNSGNGTKSGHVRIFELIGGVWSQIGPDIDGEHPGDISGASVSLSSNGEVVAIGAPANRDPPLGAGHVRVFRWDGTTWTQRGSDIDAWKPVNNQSNRIKISNVLIWLINVDFDSSTFRNTKSKNAQTC